MQIIPIWLQRAFSHWITGYLYVDGRGHYRSRVSGRRIVRHSRRLKRVYPDSQDFHRAAKAWLALWDAVPTARLGRSRPLAGTHARQI